MQQNARAATRRVSGLGYRHGKRALAVRRPNMRRLAAGAAGKYLDAFGHHESRVEADTEAADQRRLFIILGRFFGGSQPVDESLRARARDGAERLDQLLAAHAD